MADGWPAERICSVGEVVVHQFANAVAMIDSIQEAIDRCDGGKLLHLAFQERPPKGNHVFAGITQATNGEHLRCDVSAFNEARDWAVEFAGEFASAPHQFEKCIVEHHGSHLRPHVLIEPARHDGQGRMFIHGSFSRLRGEINNAPEDCAHCHRDTLNARCSASIDTRTERHATRR